MKLFASDVFHAKHILIKEQISLFSMNPDQWSVQEVAVDMCGESLNWMRTLWCLPFVHKSIINRHLLLCVRVERWWRDNKRFVTPKGDNNLDHSLAAVWTIWIIHCNQKESNRSWDVIIKPLDSFHTISSGKRRRGGGSTKNSPSRSRTADMLHKVPSIIDLCFVFGTDWDSPD